MDDYATDQEMDEYVSQLLAEMQIPDPVQKVVRNILDESIPEAVKERLLRPLLPSKYRPTAPPRAKKERRRKALQREFDPLPHKKEEKLEFRKTPWAIGNYLRGWQMDVSESRGADPKTFLEVARPQIQAKLEEELHAINGVKFQLALKVKLRKTKPDGIEEYTDPVLRHKQEALLKAGEINAALDKAIPHILELLEKWTQRGSGWVVDQVETLWLDIAR